VSRPVDALLEFLRAEEARGVTHVHLDEEAKELLRDLHRRAKAGNARVAVAAPQPARVQAMAEPPRAHEEPVSVPEPEAVIPVKTFQPEIIAATSGNAAAQIAALAARAEKSPAARGLGTLRETMVFSVGNPEAELMLVGEAPGYHEERQREPFVGPAGQKLNDILKAMGLQRSDIYISNIVKFRPAIPGQTTNNRKPTPDEMASCLPYIRAEVGIVKPKCIVALGGTAAEGLLGLSGSVGAMRGSWHEFEGIPTRVTYHPAYLLHGTAGQDDKRKIWEDMLAVMAQLGMPISDKQRGFFLPKA
jgi:DNA polymerase